MLFGGEEGSVAGKERMDVCMLPYVLVLLPEFIRVDAGHQSGLIVHGIGQFIIGQIPSRDEFQCIEYVVFRHVISSSK